MKSRSVAIPAVFLTGFLTLAACGGGDTDSGQNQSSGTSAGMPVGDFNEADVAFAQDMIPHHEQAIEMADLALDPNIGASDAVRNLATAIKSAQDPEIALMKGWLTAWGQPEMGDMPGHDMSSMEGMMSVEDMDMLGTLTGDAFDTMWLQMMIEHHDGAVKMAQDVKANGSNADVSTLADQVIATQTAEIEAMNALLAG